MGQTAQGLPPIPAGYRLQGAAPSGLPPIPPGYSLQGTGTPSASAPSAPTASPTALGTFGHEFGQQWAGLGHSIMHPIDAAESLVKMVAQPGTDAYAAYVKAGGGIKGLAAGAMAAIDPTKSPVIQTMEQNPDHPYAAVAGNLAGQASIAAAGEAAADAIPRVAKAAQDVTGAVKRVAVGPTPGDIQPTQAATIALRPRNSIQAWPTKIATALPDIRRAIDSAGVDPSAATLGDVEKAVAQAKADVWNEFAQNHLGQAKGTSVSTQPVADAIAARARSIDSITGAARPELLQNIGQAASLYDGKSLPIGEIEQRIQNLNNELRSAQGTFKGNAQAFRNDPAQSFKFAELDALRRLEADTFDGLTGPGAADLKARYGALKTVEDALDRRINVAQRQNPTGVFQGVGRMAGGGNVIQGGMNVLKGNVAEGAEQLAKGAYQFRVGKNIQQLGDPEIMIQQALRGTEPRSAPVPLNPATRPQPLALPPAPMEIAHPGNPNPIPPKAFLGGGLVRDPATGKMMRVQTQEVPLAQSPLVAPNPVPEGVTVRLGKGYKIVRDPKTGRMVKIKQ